MEGCRLSITALAGRDLWKSLVQQIPWGRTLTILCQARSRKPQGQRIHTLGDLFQHCCTTLLRRSPCIPQWFQQLILFWTGFLLKNWNCRWIKSSWWKESGSHGVLKRSYLESLHFLNFKLNILVPWCEILFAKQIPNQFISCQFNMDLYLPVMLHNLKEAPRSQALPKQLSEGGGLATHKQHTSIISLGHLCRHS